MHLQTALPKPNRLKSSDSFRRNLNAVTDIDQSTLRFGHSGTENSLSFCDVGGQFVNGVLALVFSFSSMAR